MFDLGNCKIEFPIYVELIDKTIKPRIEKLIKITAEDCDIDLISLKPIKNGYLLSAYLEFSEFDHLLDFDGVILDHIDELPSKYFGERDIIICYKNDSFEINQQLAKSIQKGLNKSELISSLLDSVCATSYGFEIKIKKTAPLYCKTLVELTELFNESVYKSKA